MPVCFNREYRPTKVLDLEALDLERSWWGVYVDDAAQDEFYRFVNRDIATTITGLMFGPAATSFAVFNVASIRAGGEANYWGYIVTACIAVLAGVPDLYLLWRHRALDSQAAWWRSRFAMVYCLTVVWVVGHPLPPTFAACADNTDYAGYLWDRPGFTLDRVERECIDVINPYHLVGHSLAMTVTNASPRITGAIASVLVASYYTGYAQANLLNRGESVRELLAKLLVYVAFAAVVVGIKLMRYRSYQSQFETTLEAERERRRATKAADEVDGMLQAMVPASVLERLLAGEPVRDSVEEASVLFSDMAGFTAWSSSRTAGEVVEMLNVVCTRLDAEAEARGVVKIKTIGDAYWAVTGIPDEQAAHAEVLCAFALRMHGIVAEEQSLYPHWGEIALRVGVASGPLSGGIFGTSRLSYEVSGATCDLAALCEQRGVKFRVCVCSRTRALIEHTLTDQPEDHVTIRVGGGTEDDGGATEQLWLLCRQRTTHGLLSGAVPSPMGSPEESVRSGHSRSTTASAVPSAAAAAASASRRRFLAAQAATRRAGTHLDAAAKSAVQKELSLPHLVAGSQEVTPRGPPTGDRDGPRDNDYRPVGGDDGANAEAAANAEVGDGEEENVVVGTRAYNWFVMHFADEEFERGYAAFVQEQHLPIRRASNVALVTMLVVFAIGMIIEGSASDPIALATLAVGGLNAIGSLVLALVAFTPLADAVGMHVTAALVIAGMWQLEWQSLFGHYIVYTHAVFTVIIGVGVTAWPSIVIMMLNLVVIATPIVVQMLDNVWFTASVQFVVCSLAIMGFVIVGQEKHFRRQFVDIAIANQAIRSQAQRAVEQEALLLSIVPPHAVTPLTTWLLKGKDAAHAVNDSFARLNVGFIRLFGDPTEKGGSSWLFAAHVAVDDVLGRYGRWFDKVKTMGDTIMVAGPFRHTGDGDADGGSTSSSSSPQRVKQHTSSPAEQPVSSGVTVDDNSAALPSAPGDVRELSPSNPTDRRGGQQSDSSVAESGVALLEAMRALKEGSAASGGLICGLHTGEVLGVVLGTSRLCYDIFGDAVNTAARTMTSLKGALAEEHANGAYCAVSSDFFAAVNAEANSNVHITRQHQSHHQRAVLPAGIDFSGPQSAQAKGKESLEVHAVRFRPSDSHPNTS